MPVLQWSAAPQMCFKVVRIAKLSLTLSYTVASVIVGLPAYVTVHWIVTQGCVNPWVESVLTFKSQLGFLQESLHRHSQNGLPSDFSEGSPHWNHLWHGDNCLLELSTEIKKKNMHSDAVPSHIHGFLYSQQKFKSCYRCSDIPVIKSWDARSTCRLFFW